ncbi:MAG: hypothetical protein KF752_19335 [Pirellulaceae bacterium]|nr:hypothetical protein [Pirellulaceae bacterium]
MTERQWLMMMVAVFVFTSPALGDATSRMQIGQLKATRAALEALRDEWQAVSAPPGEFRDYRAQLHVHTHFSHDSRSPIEEILQAAQECNTQVLMFNDHPSDEYDFFKDGYQGLRDGVLMVAGAEKGGFLVYPNRSIQANTYEGPQGLANLVRSDDGLIFLSHLEERMDWAISGITGNEIYNTHADVMEEKRFLSALKNPLMLMGLMPAIRDYPQEMFGAILDYPADYLRRWDELCQTARHTGVAANDAHHNQVIRAYVTEDQQVAIEDALGKRVATLDPEKVALVKPLVAGRKPGDVILELDLDPYPRSFQHVSTHLLMRDLTREEVWDALKSSRAYVSFEWLANPTGFWFAAQCGDQRIDVGGETTLVAGEGAQLQLAAAAPLPVLFKLLRHGQVVHEHRGREFEFVAQSSGVYRLEAWLQVAGELKPWILTNPIYVRDAQVRDAGTGQ